MTTIRLVVDLEPETPIRGRISSGTDAARPFHGWLELASAIETLRNAAAAARETSRADHAAHGEECYL